MPLTVYARTQAHTSRVAPKIHYALYSKWKQLALEFNIKDQMNATPLVE